MTERARAVERTRDDILQAAYDLWLELPYDEMTLEGIADRAGVSRQTVYRHFGTKDELAQAVMEWRHPRDVAMTASQRPGDVPAAVTAIISQYETAGDAYVRTLHMADRVPAADQILEGGRDAHRAWVAHVFGPYLPPHEGERREAAILTLYAATDVMIWKLLRRDFGRSRAQTEDAVRTLVEGALHRLSTSSEEET